MEHEINNDQNEYCAKFIMHCTSNRVARLDNGNGIYYFKDFKYTVIIQWMRFVSFPVLNLDNRKEKEIFWRTSSSSDASNFYDYEPIKAFTQGMLLVTAFN